ncbi:muts domain V-domain-containing protein [Phascolomyces articulosus]|uniref:DNA mismatch repair protein MSH3 n=1 Tax=Phascolomyces articulosus TaxID=60185 RepID=A0AAD5PJA9_9FUNG|nr:muts domain V-domain-containing protein [Phascolomyces articulosus]
MTTTRLPSPAPIVPTTTTSSTINKEPQSLAQLEKQYAFDSTQDPHAAQSNQERDLVKEKRHAEFVARFGQLEQEREQKRRRLDNEEKKSWSPLELQVLELKEKHPGVLLAIEVGYKFRFFGDDAKTASRVLHIAHFIDRNFYVASIPTHRLAVHVRRLVHAGYKVGVVRQTETAALKASGSNKGGPFLRELKHLYTKGTFVDEMAMGSELLDLDENTTSGSSTSSSNYLLCIVEEKRGGGGPDERVQIGLVAVQPGTGDVTYDSFVDGYMRSELETRILHIEPCELLLPFSLSKATEKVVKHMSMQRTTAFGESVRVERMPENDTFMSDYNMAFTHVSEFYTRDSQEKDEKNDSSSTTTSSTTTTSKVMFSEILRLPDTVIKALAATIRYLSEFGLQHALQLTKYFVHFSSRSHMLLNGNTMANLEIYRNSTNFSEKGSLFSVLNHTSTSFGRRLLRKWVGRPLVDVKQLNMRINAVDELLTTDNPKKDKAKKLLKQMPDLEKGLSRIHYGQSSPKELVQVLDTLLQIATTFHNNIDPVFESSLLNDIFTLLPTIRSDVIELQEVINREALNSVDRKIDLLKEDDRWPELAQEKKNIASVEKELDAYLIEQKPKVQIPTLQYVHIAGIEYLLEVKNTLTKKVPREWIKINGTKAASRFHTPWLISKLKERERHRELLNIAFEKAYRTFLSQVTEKYETFRDVVLGLAQLDCLFSLTIVAQQPNYVKPTYSSDHTAAQLKVTNGRHPMVEKFLSDAYVPNDIDFDMDQKRTMILTGANMGGKSSYVRQVALIAIMGQIGSYVPAEAATLGIFDAVYTRMGALDNMLAGESTFMVELHETSDIMRQATPRSLVILDELGRGTSTHDGMAIAYAVLRHFITEIRSITLFVTHYPFLAELADEYPESTTNGYMNYIEDSDGDLPNIIFLYKLVQGISTRSYGINVARLADIPRNVLQVAKAKAIEMETNVNSKVEQQIILRALSNPEKYVQQLRKYLGTKQ